jgi:hypothetical protein
MPQLVNETKIEILPEVTYGTEPTWTTPLIISPSEWSDDNVRPNYLDDPTQTVDGGSHQPVPASKASRGSVTIGAKAEGIRTSPADTVQAANTGLSILIGTAMDAAPELTTSTITTGTPTTTSVDVSGAGSMTTTGIGLAAFEVTAESGEYFVRPFTESSDTLTLLMALPQAPAVGDDVKGGAVHHAVHGATANYSASMRAIGNDDLQNTYVQGIVSSMTMEAEVDQIATLSFDSMFYDGTRDNTDVQPSDDVPQGVVWSDGELLIAQVGSTDWYCIGSWKATVETGGELQMIRQPCGDAPVSGYRRSGVQGRMTIEIYHDERPSSVTGETSTTWEDAFDAGGSENLWQILVCPNRTPGTIAAAYMSRARGKDISNTTDGELDGRTIVFEYAEGGTSGTDFPMFFYQG